MSGHRKGFLSLDAIDIWGWIIVVGGCPVQCRMFANTPGFYLGDKGSAAPRRRSNKKQTKKQPNKKTSHIANCPLGGQGQNLPHLRTASLEYKNIPLFRPQISHLNVLCIKKQTNKETKLYWMHSMSQVPFSKCFTGVNSFNPPNYKADTYKVYKL